MNSGTYKIINKINNKSYYGSSVNLKKRRRIHFWELKNNIHSNKHLQAAFNLNPDSFEFVVIEYCNNDESVCKEKEQILLNEHWDAGVDCYNICKDVFCPRRDRKLSEETIKKMSLSRIGDNNPFYGKKHSKETKEEMSKNRSGKNAPMYGKKHTQEAKDKISRGHVGKIAHNKGVPCSDKQKKKISEKNAKIVCKTFLSPAGEKFYVKKNLQQFAKQIHIDVSGLRKLASGKFRQYKGWIICEK